MDESFESRPSWCPPRLETADPDVSRIKFQRQVDNWHSNQDHHRSRGCLLAGYGDRWAELILLSATTPHVVTVCVGVDYVNFDIEAPSLTFLNPVTRDPAPPFATPVQWNNHGEVMPLIVEHPDFGRPMLCQPGVFEYHSHPQHDGVPWLGVIRERGEGNLAVIADRLWEACTRFRQLVPQLNLRVVAGFDAAQISAAGLNVPQIS